MEASGEGEHNVPLANPAEFFAVARALIQRMCLLVLPQFAGHLLSHCSFKLSQQKDRTSNRRNEDNCLIQVHHRSAAQQEREASSLGKEAVMS